MALVLPSVGPIVLWTCEIIMIKKENALVITTSNGKEKVDLKPLLTLFNNEKNTNKKKCQILWKTIAYSFLFACLVWQVGIDGKGNRWVYNKSLGKQVFLLVTKGDHQGNECTTILNYRSLCCDISDPSFDNSTVCCW